MPREIFFKFRNFDKQEDEEKMNANPLENTSIDTTASTPNPRNNNGENARRASKRNLGEDIRSAQREVDDRERKIEPLRQGLKNARSRLARLQKVKAAESEK